MNLTKISIIILALFVVSNIFNCYTVIKKESPSPQVVVMEKNRPLPVSKPEQKIKYRYEPQIDSEIQLLYYTYGELGDHSVLTEINFFGHLRRYLIKKNERELLEQFILNMDDYENLAKLFLESGFMTYPQYLPLTNKQRTPSHGIVIFFRNNEGQEFKSVGVDLTADHKYYPKGFFNLYYKLLSATKDPSYSPN